MCKEQFAKDIDRAVFPGLQGGPHDHVNAAKAVAFHEASLPAFKEYAAQIVKNAKALAEELLAHEFTLVSGGTDNHLILVDLINKEITGKEAEEALDQANITCNKNMIPFDPRTPFNPSGIRLGTPALTSRGMKSEQMKLVGQFIAEVIHNRGDESVYQRVKGQVRELCQAFPLYPDL
jgi:glycine hydroxymethyltransferase